MRRLPAGGTIREAPWNTTGRKSYTHVCACVCVLSLCVHWIRSRGRRHVRSFRGQICEVVLYIYTYIYIYMRRYVWSVHSAGTSNLWMNERTNAQSSRVWERWVELWAIDRLFATITFSLMVSPRLCIV